ncbi:hypothetical protein H4S14_004121 [Agrobacterium vitis]|nr:hypothetical protein [Agrobacterium vitis]MBE1440347.1 hypothetical protein [Agrobacterium vitis]
MKLEPNSNSLPPSMGARIVSALVALGWLYIGASEILSPTGWDAIYGVPLAGADGLSFVQSVGARNTAISLITIYAAVRALRSTLAILFAGIALIAAFDFYIVSSAVGPAAGIKHAIFVVVMAAISLWVSFSNNKRSTVR